MTPEPAAEEAQFQKVERARQGVRLSRRLRGDMIRNSPYQLRRFTRSALGRRKIRSVEDLSSLPPMNLRDVARLSDLLTEPRGKYTRRHGPVEWATETEVPLGYSQLDLVTLAGLGEQMLERWQIRRGDVIVNLVPVSQTRDHLQIALGARRRKISHLATEDVFSAVDLDPSVLAGSLGNLTTALEAGPVLHRLHTVVLTGPEPLPAPMSKLQAMASDQDVEIVRMFGPAGALGAWSQCRGATGFHTAPDKEIVEIVDVVSGLPVHASAPGVVIWTGIGWHCMSMIRMQLPFFGSLEHSRCPGCGTRGTRIHEHDQISSFCDLLDATEGVALWAAELHGSVDGDQLWIWVALEEEEMAVHVLARLSADLGDAVRIELASVEAVRSRIDNAGGERFGDRRAFASD